MKVRSSSARNSGLQISVLALAIASSSQLLAAEPATEYVEVVGQAVSIDKALKQQRSSDNVQSVVHADGTPVYGVSSEMDGVAPESLGDGRFGFRIRFDALPLLPGRYRLRAVALDAEGLRLFDQREREIVVRGESREFGLVRLPHRWGRP